ncbi:MAG TPA: cyclic nucleotide-binding domain-containing protein [Lacunisphaera sp.]|nr:cyclic nucleotide-binding domain-containing protein [Lacunisphaera sp.]
MTVTLPGQKPTTAELGALLNQSVLILSPDIRVFRTGTERFVLKYQPGRRYLVVTPQQWATLQEFKGGQRVTSVLCGLISSQKNPSLRDLYELVIKATQAGILQTPPWPVPPAELLLNWPIRINGMVMRWVTGISLLAAVASLFLRPPQVPKEPLWLVLGWLVACVSATIGSILAACVVKAAGGDIYRMRFVWQSLVPHFRVGLSDTLMVGRIAEANAAAARLAPHFIALAVTAWFAPGMVLAVLGGTLIALSPLWRSPLLDLLGALYRTPHLSTGSDFVLPRDRLFRLATLARQQIEDRKYLLRCLGATVAWLALVVLLAGGLLNIHAFMVLDRIRAAGNVVNYTLLGVLGLCGAAVLGAIGFAAWSAFRHMQARWKEEAERQIKPAAVLVSPDTIAEWLGKSVLFRELPKEDIAAVAAVVKPEEHKKGSFVVREGEPGDHLYIVLSGRLEVRRDYAPGRSEPVAGVEVGDIFGEIALLHSIPRTRSVRALSPSILLSLHKADFERLVLSKISRQAVADAVQKVSFLQRAELTRNWSHATMSAFARRSKILEAPENALILEEGRANHCFYLVHRGEVSIRVKDRELRRLRSGDSFGELSLLGTGLATANVVVVSKTCSVLEISARDFLDFISQDFMIGLMWEETRKKRKDR